MTGRAVRLRALLLTFALAAAPLAAPGGAEAQTAEQGRLLAQALSEARSGNWTNAAAYAGRTNSAVVRDIVLWTRLRDGVGSWQEYQGFLARNPTWPNIVTLRRHGERLIPQGADANAVIGFFGGEPPRTGTGALRLADALAARGRGGEAQAMLVRAWPDLSLTATSRRRWSDATAARSARITSRGSTTCSGTSG
jgi:soluble lytic murein transglycosylase